MTDDRIPTELWVSSHLRGLTSRAIGHYVVHRGAPAAGTVMVKVLLRRDACRLYSQSRDMDGNMGWLDPFDGNVIDENRADAYIKRSLERDPDLWVIEVEEPTGQMPFEGKIL